MQPVTPRVHKIWKNRIPNHAYLLSYTVSVKKLWTQKTRIIHDVWRLLILSNEEKWMIMKILKKEWFIWKRNDLYENFEKGGGGGGGGGGE